MAVMDKWLVLESLIPMLEKVTSREPGVLMAMLGIYDEVRIMFRSRMQLCLHDALLCDNALWVKGKFTWCEQALRVKKFGFDKDLLARKILPTVIPLSMEPCLNLDQVVCCYCRTL